MVKEYFEKNTTFPVTLIVDDLCKLYTFAVFGKSGFDINEIPIVTYVTEISVILSSAMATTSGNILCIP